MFAKTMTFALRSERKLACVCLSALLAAGLTVGGCQSASTTQGGATTIQAIPADHTYAPLPEALASFGAVAQDGWLYVYGGHRVNPHEYHVEAVSPSFRRLKLDEGKTWQSLPDGPRAQGLNLAAAKGRVYRLGGMQPRNAKGEKTANYSLTEAAYYDVAKGTWQSLPDLPEPRSSHDLAIVDNTLYVLGGWNMNADQGDVWFDHGLSLDLTKRDATWQKVEQPFVRRALIVAVLDKDIYVLGGMDDGNEIGGDVDIYDTVAKQWRKGPAIPGRKLNGFSPAAVVLDGQLYLSVFDGTLFRLNQARDGWDKVAQAKPRIVHRLAAHGDNILIVAGAAGTRRLHADIEVVKINADGSATVANPPTPQAGQAKPQGHGHGHGHGQANPHAAPTKAKTQAAADEMRRQTVCPVMTSAQVGSKDDILVQYQGVEVRLCCGGCESKWKRDVNAYLLPRYLPQLVGHELPKRDIEQVFCPVYKDRVVSSKDPHVVYQGKKVYFYNHSAMKKWNADPARYADPKLLPQLASK